MSETTRTGAGARDADLGAAPARAVVLGAGTMGRGIAQLLAQAGSRDSLPEPTVLRKRLQRLSANMQENLVIFSKT
ncbi:MAG: 3-hydroxyacyl-CoA dehydrogenase NAD-binding domain-containing protein [Deinococcales bacterium]